MAKSTPILLGDYYDNFINAQVQSGRFSSASEVVRAALRLLEQQENHKNELVNGLMKGENEGFVKKIDRKKLIKSLHSKHVNNKP
jgi:antitoxin ParD1/3/4